MSAVGRLVMDVLPEFGGEMRRLLLELGEAGMAAQVAGLRIVEICGCGDTSVPTLRSDSAVTPSFSVGSAGICLGTI